ncbi:MAG TPA: hypothetical protein PK402_04405, partial [Tepidisphaeraceae bacterium]|nr:hypothetical protein [Tepidisphaeraceae bacterium]
IFVTHRAEVPGLNFSYMILPATPSGVVALVNDRVTPPTLEIWSTRPWKRLSGPTKVYRQFKRSTYAISPDGQVLSRLTDLPRFGLETVTSLGQPYRALAEFSNPELEHELIGMPSASRAVLRMNSADGKASIKIVSLGEGAENYEFEVGSLPPLILEPKCQAISLLPDGIGFAVAGRDESGSAAVMIHRFEPMRTQRLALSLNKRLKIAPLALTASADNTQIALLISADGELLLFTWLLPKTSGGSIFDVENLPTYEYIPGSEQFIRGNFTGQNPLLWLDDQTILLFGRLVLDVETGISLQTIAEPNITSVIDWDGQTLSLLKNDSAVVTLKLNLSALRK